MDFVVKLELLPLQVKTQFENFARQRSYHSSGSTGLFAAQLSSPVPLVDDFW